MNRYKKRFIFYIQKVQMEMLGVMRTLYGNEINPMDVKKKVLKLCFQSNMDMMYWVVFQKVFEECIEKLSKFFQHQTQIAIHFHQDTIEFLYQKIKTSFSMEEVEPTFEKVIQHILEFYDEFIFYYFRLNEYITEDGNDDSSKKAIQSTVLQYLLNEEIKIKAHYVLVCIFKKYEQELMFILNLKYNVDYTVDSVFHLFE